MLITITIVIIMITGATRVMIADILDAKLALARSMGDFVTINSKTEDLAARVRELTGGVGVSRLNSAKNEQCQHRSKQNVWGTIIESSLVCLGAFQHSYVAIVKRLLMLSYKINHSEDLSCLYNIQFIYSII